MRSRTLSHLAILGFVVAGVVGMALRYNGRIAAREALEDSLWKLTYDVSFKCQSDEAVVRLALPASSQHVTVGEPRFITRPTPILPGSDRVLEVSRTRVWVATARQLGQFRVTGEVPVRLHSDRPAAYRELVNLSADARARYTRDEPNYLPKSSGVQEVLREADGKWQVEEELLQWIFDYCAKKLQAAEPNTVDDSVIATLREGIATPLGRTRTMVALCRAANLPARMVTGFELRQSNDIQPRLWLEVFRENHWAPFDPENGHARSLPSNFIPIRRGGEQIWGSRRGAEPVDVAANFSVVRLPPPTDALRSGAWSPLRVFDLTRLPVEMHEVLTLLLLLPFGALIVAVFRNVIGIPTFGTFAPALFAVSFLYADWVSGLIVLMVVLAAGFLGRWLIERLRLLMVPRLSIILTIIILCVVLGVSALDYLALTPSAKAVLLPLVIVTILIERFYVTIEEDSLGFAARLVAGTLVVSACCFALLRWDAIGRLILVYPEAHFLTIAAFIGIGRYTGFRLAELWRFRDLVDRENR